MKDFLKGLFEGYSIGLGLCFIILAIFLLLVFIISLFG